MTTIAQLSDLHLGTEPLHQERFERVVGYLASLSTPVDAVLVTGDVFDDGSSGDYAAVRAALAGLGVPVAACPGNHDARDGFRSFLGLPAGAAGDPVDTVTAVGGVAVVAVDSMVPSADWGVLGEVTLDWLEATLAAARGPVLLAVHHVPVVLGSPLIDGIGLRDPGRLASLVERHPQVVGVVCGHAHTAAAAQFAGRPLVVAPAVSSTLLLPGERGAEPVFDRTTSPSFVLHLVDEGRLVSHVRAVA